MVHLGLRFQSPWRSFCIAGSHLGAPGSCSAMLVIIRACLHRGCLLGPGPSEVAGSGLVPLRLLAWVWSHGGHWLRPGPVEGGDSGLLPRRLLPGSSSCRGRWLGPDGFSSHLLLTLTSKFIPLSVHLDIRCLGHTRQGNEIKWHYRPLCNFLSFPRKQLELLHWGDLEVVVTSLCTHKGAVPFGTQPLCSNRKILVIRYRRKVSTVIH